MYVDFKEFNWYVCILSPIGYNAFKCVGECSNPLPARLNATNHAVIQSLLNSLNPEIPGPYCNHDEMLVEAGGCR
ncbi:unnamed protein product, partial [Mesorhabditis belari]|uniref:TGF-beta family profile domain-containing protein n=1 Tax=Mesorhabditis belari TaxID=2138241 RepID=A0AAF3EBW1_9BILA